MITLEYLDLALGEREYHVPAASLHRAEQWRQQLQAQVNDWLALIKDSGLDIDTGNLSNLAEMDVMKLLPILGRAMGQLNISLSAIGELIINYADNLEQDREYILAHTTTKQALYALLEMVKQEYPFGWIGEKLDLNGQEPVAISKNSPSPSGASRRKK